VRELMKQFGWVEPIIPMNAKDPKAKLESLFKDENYVSEIKYDGSRYLSIGTPESGRFFSRKKSENKKTPELLGLPVDKTANVPHLAFEFAGKTFILDGEVFYPGKKSNDVTSIMGCDPWKALMRQGFGEFTNVGTEEPLLWRLNASEEWIDVYKKDKDYDKFEGLGKIHYMVYDILYYGGMDIRDQPWHVRRDMLEEVYERWFEESEFIHLSEVSGSGENDKRDLLKYAEANGEEGIMLKNIHSTYQSDKRPEHHWYKVKGEITMDVVLMGYEPGEGKYAGQIGSIIFGLYKDGVLTKAGTCSGMTDELRKELTELGNTHLFQVFELKAMERTAKGMFRHPRFIRFREDKNVADCLWENEVE
jgi:ATP-dependent DNA ligase